MTDSKSLHVAVVAEVLPRVRALAITIAGLLPSEIVPTTHVLRTSAGTTLLSFPFPVDVAAASANPCTPIQYPPLPPATTAVIAAPRRTFTLRLPLARLGLVNDPSRAHSVLPGGTSAHIDQLNAISAARCRHCHSILTASGLAAANPRLHAPGSLLPLPSDDWHELLDAWACHAESFRSVQKLVDRGSIPLPSIHSAFLARNYIILTASDLLPSAIRLGGRRRTRRGLFIVTIQEAICAKCSNIIGELIFSEKCRERIDSDPSSITINDVVALRMDRYAVEFDTHIPNIESTVVSSSRRWFRTNYINHLAFDLIEAVGQRSTYVFEIIPEKYIENHILNNGKQHEVFVPSHRFVIRIRVISWESGLFASNLTPVPKLTADDYKILEQDDLISSCVPPDTIYTDVDSMAHRLEDLDPTNDNKPVIHPIMRVAYMVAPYNDSNDYDQVIDSNDEDHNVVQVDLTEGIQTGGKQLISNNNMSDVVPMELLKEVHEQRMKDAAAHGAGHHHHHHHHHNDTQRIVRRRQMATNVEQFIAPGHNMPELLRQLEASVRITYQNPDQLKIIRPSIKTTWTDDNNDDKWKLGFIFLEPEKDDLDDN